MPFYKKCDKVIELFEDNYTFREISDFIVNDIPLQKHYCVVCGKEIHSNDRRYPVTCSRSCATKRQMTIRNKKELIVATPINSKKSSFLLKTNFLIHYTIYCSQSQHIFIFYID